MLAYVETGMGCGLREGTSLKKIERDELESVGTYNGVQVCRKATKEDISNVTNMGGWCPEKYRNLV